jgi:large subunit ribosomal protein L25
VGSSLIDLKIAGQDKALDVIIKAIKHEEIKGAVQHVDFWAVNMKETLQTTVAITVVGSSEGERAGGTLMHALRELHIEARPKDLPEHIEIDVTALEIGDSLTVADIPAPAGVTILDDLETLVASVAAPHAEVEEVVEEIEAGEVPEVGKESADSEE